MRLLIDEDVPRSTVPGLRLKGHEVWDVRDLALRGQPDTTIPHRAQELQAVSSHATQGSRLWRIGDTTPESPC
ncbi:MAG: DUF5615 family PIN-like protein [bacterium]